MFLALQGLGPMHFQQQLVEAKGRGELVVRTDLKRLVVRGKTDMEVPARPRTEVD